MSDRHPSLLTVGSTVAFVVNVQDAFRTHIHGFEEMVAASQTFLAGCQELGVPVVVSEQYPAGLGHTVGEFEGVLADARVFEKVEISACAAPAFADVELGDPATTKVAVLGIETHVCVNQTVHDLLHRGYTVHVLADCVGSRDPWQREMALERLAHAGAIVTTMESALFEMMERAGTESFKKVQGFVKKHDQGRRLAADGVPA